MRIVLRRALSTGVVATLIGLAALLMAGSAGATPSYTTVANGSGTPEPALPRLDRPRFKLDGAPIVPLASRPNGLGCYLEITNCVGEVLHPAGLRSAGVPLDAGQQVALTRVGVAVQVKCEFVGTRWLKVATQIDGTSVEGWVGASAVSVPAAMTLRPCSPWFAADF